MFLCSFAVVALVCVLLWGCVCFFCSWLLSFLRFRFKRKGGDTGTDQFFHEI